MTMLVPDPIRWWGVTTPHRSAITFDGRDTLTYGELDTWTDRVAERLVELGLRPGDRLGIVGPNSLEWCAAAIGGLKVGATLACFQHRLVSDELAVLIEDSEPTIVAAGPEHVAVVDQISGRAVDFSVLPLDELTALRGQAGERFERAEVDPDDPAVIVFTSGTTSKPKGVIFTHRTVFGFVAEHALMEPAFTQEARMIFVLSLGGAPGVLWALLHMTIHGAHLFLETGFDPETALTRIVDERIEIMMGVPVLFDQITRVPAFTDADVSSLVATFVGGARVEVPLLEKWTAKGVLLRQIYGMTELGGISTANSREKALDKPQCVGIGSVFTQHRVVRDDGTDCDPEELGEIIVRGPSVTPGYWRNPEASAEALRDGWFHSGDIGTFDSDGDLRMVDRLKDMIITGGFNVAPAEVEAVVAEVPGVLENAVVAADDPKWGEAVAVIVRTDGSVSAEQIVAHCQEHLSGYKVPKQVVFADEALPRMPSGKLAKRVLRDQFAPQLTPDR
jgi:fatty-acyl-CoA synthase